MLSENQCSNDLLLMVAMCRYGADDYTVIFCYVLSIGMVIFHFVLVANGSGQDFFNLTIPKITNFLFVRSLTRSGGESNY